MAQADTAAVNGAETAQTHLPPCALSRDQLYNRIRRHLLWQGYTLVAAAQPPTSALAQPEYLIFKVQLKDQGKVELVDLVDLGVSLGVLDKRVESVMAHWSEGPE